MARIIVRSGLPGFVLLDSIHEAGPLSISGHKRFNRSPHYCAIEALAQLGAFHVRFLNDFAKHAFLLAVKRCSLPAVRELTGDWMLSGKLASRSSSAFSYELSAVGDTGETMEGEFLFSVAEYDGTLFKEEIMVRHYRKVFSCLRASSKTNC
ncbi:MAG: hypothetical protein AAGU11_02755 [Syntrophobacteraceae bacterium]